MKITPVHSFDELERGISQTDKSFLLLYKSGTEQSECALERLSNITGADSRVYTADVNEVRDIHGRLEVTSAPSLVIFDGGRVVNIMKGCQTESAYDSVLAGRLPGALAQAGDQKVKQVTVYTTPTCTWCTTIKTYLDQKQVRYREINVASDTSAAEAMVRKSGQQGVPQTEINGQMIVGFDKNRINQLLDIK
ncbi:MAG: thioredoxin family protein [Bacteroidales bacterium]|nr:thioredoxin family protein [Bacteroidales bacterium]